MDWAWWCWWRATAAAAAWLLALAAAAGDIGGAPLCPRVAACLYTGSAHGDHFYKLHNKSLVISKWEDAVSVSCYGAALGDDALPAFPAAAAPAALRLLDCRLPPAADAAPLPAALARLNVTLRRLARLELEDLQPADAAALAPPALAAFTALTDLELRAATAAAAAALPAGALAAAPRLASLQVTRVLLGEAARELPAGLRALRTLDAGLAEWRAAWAPAARQLSLLESELGSVDVAGEALQALDVRAAAPEGAAGPALVNATLRGADNVAGVSWAGAAALERLRVLDGGVAALPARWLAGRGALLSLELRGLALRALPAGLLAGCGALRALAVVRCGLAALPAALLQDSPLLDTLDLSGNALTQLPTTLVAGGALRVLDLSRNALTAGGAGPALRAAAPALEELRLDYNPLGDLCAAPRDPPAAASRELVDNASWLRGARRLARLSARATGATRLCADWRLQLTQLRRLQLAHNNITRLQAAELLWPRAAPAEVDLRDNPLRVLHYTAEDYEAAAAAGAGAGAGAARVLLGGAALACDCRQYWWLRALQQRLLPLAAHELRCANGSRALALALPALQCDVSGARACPPACRCTLRPGAQLAQVELACNTTEGFEAAWAAAAGGAAWGAARAELRVGGVTSLPPLPPRAAALRLRNATLSALRPQDIPDDIELLDLRESALPWSGSLAAGLLGPPARRLLLRGAAPCGCGPAARAARAALQAHSDQVLDYSELSCAEAACGWWAGALGGAAAAAVGAALALGLGARGAVRARVKAALRAAGLRAAAAPSLRELGVAAAALDAAPGMEYDVYLSYAACDWDAAMALAARLRGAGWRVCEPAACWAAGAWRPAELARDVARARRVLALVSPGACGAGAGWARAERRLAAARRQLLLVDAAPLPDHHLEGSLRARPRLQLHAPDFWPQLQRALRPRRAPPRAAPHAAPLPAPLPAHCE